jgi:hypothetical protein
MGARQHLAPSGGVRDDLCPPDPDVRDVGALMGGVQKGFWAQAVLPWRERRSTTVCEGTELRGRKGGTETLREVTSLLPQELGSCLLLSWTLSTINKKGVD